MSRNIVRVGADRNGGPAVDTVSAERTPLVARIERALGSRPVLPRYGLQYRVLETGQGRTAGPRDLDAVIAALTASTGDGAPAVHEVAPSLFARATADADVVAQQMTRVMGALRALDVAVDAAALGGATSTVRVLAQAAARALGGRSSVLAEDRHTPTFLAEDADGAVRLPRDSVVIRVRQGRGRTLVHVWITHELPWIDADDPRLWYHLLRAHEDGARLVIIARKVGVPLFPLCRALGARAVQFYAQLVPAGPAAALRRLATALDRAGWPFVRPASTEGIPATLAVLSRVGAAPSPPRADAAALASALDTAHALGLDRGGVGRPAALLEWGRTSGLRLPRPWLETVEGWAGRRPVTDGPITAADPVDATLGGPAFDDPPEHAAGVQAVMPTADEEGASPPPRTGIHRLTPAAEVDRETWTALLDRLDPEVRADVVRTARHTRR